MTSPAAFRLSLLPAALRLLAGCALAISLLAPAPAPAQSNNNQGEERTANRSVAADLSPYPAYIMKRPGYYEFTPMVSNHDPVNSHDAQWAGQDWDTARWPKGWTSAGALRKFYAAGIFTRQNIGATTREVTLGPTFFTLSALDQNRTLKLLTDEAGAFGASAAPVILRDHATRKVVGSYSPTGLQLF